MSMYMMFNTCVRHTHPWACTGKWSMIMQKWAHNIRVHPCRLCSFWGKVSFMVCDCARYFRSADPGASTVFCLHLPFCCTSAGITEMCQVGRLCSRQALLPTEPSHWLLFLIFLEQHLALEPKLVLKLVCTPGWPQTWSDPPTSAS